MKTETIWLWHDDVRPPPDPEQWVWARTNDEAKYWLKTGAVEIIDMDHDMGLHDLEPSDEVIMRDDPRLLRGFDEDNGLKLVEWMIENDLVPPILRIHSWNVAGAKRMVMALNAAGHYPDYKAYEPPRVNVRHNTKGRW